MAGQFYDTAMSQRQEALAATPDMVAQRNALIAALDPKPGEAAADIGAGNGFLLRDLLDKVGATGRVAGVDGSEAMVEMAGHVCPEAELHLADAADLPLDDGAFDAATAAQLLCFLPEPDRALAEMARILRPGGRLAILDSDWGSLVWNCRDRALMDRTVALLTGEYADAHVPRSLSRRLEAAGFRITARRSFAVLNWAPDAESYAGQTAGFVEAMMAASPDFTADDWAAFQADQQAVAEAGEFMFSLNRYVFCAEKP